MGCQGGCERERSIEFIVKFQKKIVGGGGVESWGVEGAGGVGGLVMVSGGGGRLGCQGGCERRIEDIQKCIYGYPKIDLWISKNRFLDIHNSFLDILK